MSSRGGGARSDSESLRDLAYRKIREGIISQRWRPGDPLGEQQIAEGLAISRTPVREALQALAREGFVEIFPSRGTFVAKMSTDDLREIYQFREALEVQLVRLVVQRATPADIADLEDLLNTNEMGPEELDSSVATGSRFHRALARIAGNRRIADTLLNLENATLRARVLGTVRVRETREEHAALVEAIRLHNMQQAEELMRDHLEQAFEYLTGPYAVGAPVVRDTV